MALGKSLAEVGQLSNKELSEWKAYDLIEPIGSKRTDLQFAHLCMRLAAIIEPTKEHYLRDFLPDIDEIGFNLFATPEQRMERERKQAMDVWEKLNMFFEGSDNGYNQ